MSTTVIIPPPIRADVDHEAAPHVFADVTEAVMTRVEWNDAGELEVDFDLDLSLEQVNEVIRIARDQPMLFDPDGPPIPPPLIPGEGWEYMGPIAPENIITGTLQARVQIGEEMWVARYTDPTDPDSPVDPNSGIISITPDDGLRLRIPNQDDPDAEPVTLAHFPTALYDESGERVTAVFQGRADFSTATGQQFRAIGNAADGDVSSIGTSAELQLNNAVADPTSEPNVTFGPMIRSWSNTPSDYQENGWGVSGSTVVFAVRNTADGGGTRFRFMNPNTGLLDHDVQCQISPPNVAGLTVADGHIYMIFRALGKWSLSRFDLNGQISGNGANITPWVNGAGQVCIGTIDNRPTLAYRDQNGRIRIRQYFAGKEGLLETPFTWATDYSDSSGRILSGISDDPTGYHAMLFTGSRVVQLDEMTTANEAASFWSGIGSVAGAGLLPDGKLSAFNGQGSCAVYNNDPAVAQDFTARFATTLANTTTGRESGMSPVVTRTWTAKAFATVQADRLPPGTNEARFYGSTASKSRTDMYRIGQAGRSVVIGPFAKMPTTGPQPPAASQFTSAGEIPGKIVSQATIPGSSRRAVSIDAQGNAELYGLIQPFLSRYRTSNIMIPHASQTIVPMDGLAESDTTGCITHTLATGTYMVAWPGRYRIEAQLSWDNGTGYRTLIVHVNGVAMLNGFSAANTYTSCIVAKTIRLSAGAQITFSAYQNSGSALAVRGGADGNYSFATIARAAA